jgi:hypothetical protein
MVDGKIVSTDKLAGGARIHYIFQSIFVKSLEVSNSFKYFANLHMLRVMMLCTKSLCKGIRITIIKKMSQKCPLSIVLLYTLSQWMITFFYFGFDFLV